MKKNEKGSVTLIVVATVLFIFALLATSLAFVYAKRKSQLQETMILQNIYDSGMKENYQEQLEKVNYKNNLPTQYKEVEYIEATGTQYLDKINLTGNYRFVIEAFLLQENKYYNIYDGTTMLWVATDNLLELNANKSHGNVILNTKITIEADNSGSNNIVKVNGNTVITLAKVSGTTFSVSLLNRNGGQCFYGKIYSIKVYDNQKLTYNLVPCYRISDNKTGMYDTVNNKFMECKGTGQFTLGPNL